MALAYYQNAANYFAKALFPTCPVSLSSDNYYEFSKEDLLRDNWGRKPAYGKVDPTVVGESMKPYVCQVDQMIMGIDQIRQTDLSRRQGPTTMQPKQQRVKTIVEQVTADIESAVSDVPANGHASITLDQSNNAAEIYSLATADVVSAFSETIPADGHVDVTLDQTNNAAAIYSECAGQVQSTFSQGFTASADVAVTLNWHITNPSASISTSSSGSSVSATIAGHASGGEVGLNGAELSWVGEEGLEYIIPTVPARRQRGIELWKSAGRTLGVLGPDDEISAHASGGIVGKEVSNTIPYFDTDSSSQDSEKTEKETVPTNVVSDKSGVVVQVNLSPQFNISDTNDSDVIRLIKAHIKELADDLGSEIATMLSEAYENTPVTT